MINNFTLRIRDPQLQKKLEKFNYDLFIKYYFWPILVVGSIDVIQKLVNQFLLGKDSQWSENNYYIPKIVGILFLFVARCFFPSKVVFHALIFVGLRQVFYALNFWGLVADPIFNGDLWSQQDRIYASIMLFGMGNMTTWLQTVILAPFAILIPYRF